MSDLRLDTWTMPEADLGPANPLPQLAANADLHAQLGEDDAATFGQVHGCLPYLLLDGYNREKKPRDFQAVVLENDVLRATFLPELGGRLWSLWHKPAARELLHVNPVFQPANLAIRNAWISGGVEWNCGVIGHTPFTVSSVFAATLRHDDGSPVLRLYEWERVRQVVFQIDAWLPDGSPVLLVRVRIINPHARDIAMYWWSNIAADERPDVRVIAPADGAMHFGYKGGTETTPVPIHDGRDVSYPTNHDHACDYFYDIAASRRKWITAVGADGCGPVQTSTPRLLGRKLFLWGRGEGGQRWQEYLAAPGHAYIELQAGLARTQMDYVRMPAKTEWSWLEAYGLMQADAAVTGGNDWHAAHDEVERHLERLMPAARLEELHAQSGAMAERPPERIVQRGSGWGALERRRRQRAGEAPFCGEATPFDDTSLGDEQRSWLALLEESEPPGDGVPNSYMVQREWREMLEHAVSASTGGGVACGAWLHLGVMRFHAGDLDGARTAWEQSLGRRPNALALRNLAVLAKQQERDDEATELYVEACRAQPDLLPLAIECGAALLHADQPRRFVELHSNLDQSVQHHPRLRFLLARAQLELGRLDDVERFLRSDTIVPDIREGETSLTDLWFSLHERRLAAAEGAAVDDELRERVRREFPPPARINFRMSG